MNIIFLVTEDWYFVSHRLQIANFLIKKGFNVTLITKVSKHKDLIEGLGINLINIDWSRKDKDPFKFVSNILFIRKKIKDINCSILHNVALKPIFMGYFITIGLPITSINAISGLGFMQSTVGIKSKLTQFILKNGLKFIFHKKSHAIVQNKSDYEYLILNKICSKDKASLIKGVGVPEQSKREYLENNNYQILFAGRMLWSKGIREVVETAKLFEDENTINISFILAGNPDKDNPEAVPDSYLENLKQRSNIVWKEHVSDLSEIYKNTDIFLFPTKYGEGIPKVLLEAASFGVPVICSDNPGCKEIIHNGKNGIVLSSLKPKFIKEEVLSLLQNLEKRKEMSVYSQRLVASEFSDKMIHKQMLDLHKNLFEKIS